LDAEELAVAPTARRIRECLIGREAGPWLVVTVDVLEREHGGRRSDRARVDLAEARDRIEHNGDLAGEALDLVVGEPDAREIGDVNDRLTIDRHAPSLGGLQPRDPRIQSRTCMSSDASS
jgi:hypothetical protein